jgi:hypothetical protein
VGKGKRHSKGELNNQIWINLVVRAQIAIQSSTRPAWAGFRYCGTVVLETLAKIQGMDPWLEIRVRIQGQDLGLRLRIRIQDRVSRSGFRVSIQDRVSRSGFRVSIQGQDSM